MNGGEIHELRNLVGQIIGYSEVALEDADSGSPVRRGDLAKVVEAGKRLLRFVETGGPARPELSVPVATAKTRRAERSVSGRVLVVDDVEENRAVLRMRLEREGHLVDEAADGPSALSLAARSAYDAILLDIMMPGMDGFEVLERLKSDEATRPVPVVMISALGEMEHVVACLDAGAADYLTKPFEPALLRARVRNCVREKQSHDREAALLAEVTANLERVTALEKLRDDLTAMIVHDLRTPLTSILSGLQTIEAMGTADEAQTEMIGITIEGAETLLGMINDLLDVSKMEDGSMKLEIVPADPAAVARKALAQVAGVARGKGVCLEDDVPENLGRAALDEDKVRRLLVNLLGNAIKFTPAGGTVTLSLAREGAALSLSVRDTGEGIPEEAFGKIFEKFGQVESRKAGRKMSTGLGLTFCRMVAEAHGGSIGVSSVLGEGSVFTANLPVGDDGPPPCGIERNVNGETATALPSARFLS